MTSSIMNTAQSGLQAAQAGLLVTSQNIAGVSVDGFSRRNATAVVNGLAPNSAMLTGTSFSVEGFTRYHSQLLENQRRMQQAKTAYSETLVNSTEMLDVLLADQSNSLAVAYGEFFNAAGSLVSDPSNLAYRSSLTFKADVLVQRLISMADNLRVIEEDTAAALQSPLRSANDLSANLAKVNIKILEGNSSGNFTPSADYLDERDRLLMQLQKLVGGQSLINSDGTASHFIQGMPLVEKGLASEFQVSQISLTKNFIDVKLPTGTTARLSLSSIELGEAGAYVDLVQTFLPEMNRRLNALAIATVAAINTVNTGAADDIEIFAFQTTTGTKSSPLLPADIPLTAASIIALKARLDPESATYDSSLDEFKAANLVSLAPDNPADYVGISSSWATSIEELRSLFVQPVSDLVGVIGTQIASWVSENNANQSIKKVLDDRHESVSGVSLDEEAANMIKFQQLYAASSKLIQTGNQMFETLLAMMT